MGTSLPCFYHATLIPWKEKFFSNLTTRQKIICLIALTAISSLVLSYTILKYACKRKKLEKIKELEKPKEEGGEMNPLKKQDVFKMGLNVSFYELPNKAILQIVQDKNLNAKDRYHLLTTSKKMHKAIMPICKVEQLLAWIRAASSKGNAEKFLIGRLVLKGLEKKCNDFLNDQYIEEKDLSISLLKAGLEN